MEEAISAIKSQPKLSKPQKEAALETKKMIQFEIIGSSVFLMHLFCYLLYMM